MNYGALCDIEKQCREAGYTLGENKSLIEKIRFGLNICYNQSILTDSEYKKALSRLNKMVGQLATPVKELEVREDD